MFMFLPVCLGLPFNQSARSSTPFPRISFQHFSDFILSTFHPNISLSTVLLLLFSLMETPELLNLHNRQKKSQITGEQARMDNGWIRALIHGLESKLSHSKLATLFPNSVSFSKNKKTLSISEQTQLAIQLNSFIELLGLTSMDQNNDFQPIATISQAEIKPIHFICPSTAVCESAGCHSRHLNRLKLESKVSVIIPFTTYTAIALGGRCEKCGVIYYADHKSFSSLDPEQPPMEYINSAHFLKIGQTIWTTWEFANMILQAMYSFHGSAATIMDFYNRISSSGKFQVTRRHIWQAFAQISIRLISEHTKRKFTLPSRADPKRLLDEAYSQLGNQGVICLSHYCDACTHKSVYQEGEETLYVNMVVIDGLVVGATV